MTKSEARKLHKSDDPGLSFKKPAGTGSKRTRKRAAERARQNAREETRS